jgi:hypothetical protein
MILAPVVFCSAISACVSTKQVTIGKKTLLERELIGKIEPFTAEELLAASVRGPDVARADAEDQALRARRRQVFNRDDLTALKARGCVGEGRDARLVSRSCTLDPENERLRARLVDEENHDRQTLLAWVVASDPSLRQTDLPDTTKLYVEMLRRELAPGTWWQADDGRWAQR